MRLLTKLPLLLGVGAALLAFAPFVQAAGIEIITDPLRVLTNGVQGFDYLTRIIVFLFSSVVAVIGFMAWKRNPTARVKWVALAFGLLAFKWLLKVMDLFVSSGAFFPDHAENVIELASLALIAYALFAPRKE